MQVLALLFLALQAGGALGQCKRHTLPSTYDPTVAQTIYNVGTSLGVPAIVMQAGFEAAWTESHLNNVNYGCGTSVGVFQQTNQWGGTVVEREDPTWAATSFFNKAMSVYNQNPNADPGTIAQLTQGSGFPDRYDNAAQKATDIQNAIQGGNANNAQNDGQGTDLDCPGGIGPCSNAAADGGTDDPDGDGSDDDGDEGDGYNYDDYGDYGDYGGGDYGGDDSDSKYGGDGDDGGDDGGGGCRRSIGRRQGIACD